MPYTITEWRDRPGLGGPVFHATLGDDFYRVSAIRYFIEAHDGTHELHETVVWRNGDEVWFAKDTTNVVDVFHDYLTSEGLYA